MSAETDRRTMDAERKRELARQRYARFVERKRDGAVVLEIVVDRGWWSEALSKCGWSSPIETWCDSVLLGE